MKPLVTAFLAACLAGCMSHPAPPPPPYHVVAQGAGAHWRLIIDDRFLTFIPGAGQQPILQPVPPVIHGFAGEIYQTQRINVNIVHRQCSDMQSDRTYPDTVQVHVDGRLYNGCGGL